jgi:Pyruvate/2-oxoacid:ferredoxin oxidoreductase delta subunit
MKGKNIAIAVFSGTGNSLEAARALTEAFEEMGHGVALYPMERSGDHIRPSGDVLGIVTTVACFSTYPTAWRFIDSLPPGEGREAFFLATMGGFGGGMQGPVRKALTAKGYMPIGSLVVKMPGNYGNKILDEVKNRSLKDSAVSLIREYARDLEEGTARWPGGIPLISGFFAALAHGRKPWDLFHRIFPLVVAAEKCTACAMCVKLCPENNIALKDGRAVLGDRCESCQRCVAFCPNRAIYVPGKPSVQYRGTSLESIMSLRNSGAIGAIHGDIRDPIAIFPPQAL